MSRKFITSREIEFISAVTRELIQEVVQAHVLYYAIVAPSSPQRKKVYDEAVDKDWAPPVKVDALVLYDNPRSRSTGRGIDSVYSLEVYFHFQELLERNVVPREGDFVEYGQIFYEIASVTQPQLVFGQVNEKVMTKCVCVASREGQFQAGGRSSEGVDNSHPVQRAVSEEK